MLCLSIWSMAPLKLPGATLFSVFFWVCVGGITFCDWYCAQDRISALKTIIEKRPTQKYQADSSMFVLSSFKHTSIILYPTFTFHILGRCRSLPPCFISCFGLRHIPFVVVCLNLYLIPYVCMYFNCRSRFDGDAFYVNSMSIFFEYYTSRVCVWCFDRNWQRLSVSFILWKVNIYRRITFLTQHKSSDCLVSACLTPRAVCYPVIPFWLWLLCLVRALKASNS